MVRRGFSITLGCWAELVKSQRHRDTVNDRSPKTVLSLCLCGACSPISVKPAESVGRSIGGDEVALVYAPYVATDTDRRLFIADAGNARIVSVRLDYHATERVALSGN